MAAHVRAVEIQRKTRLEQYRSIEHLEAQVDACARLGAEVAELLGTGTVWMLNSTEYGGGVAEMMPRLCSLMNDAGVDTRWLVLEPGDASFFAATKSLHNMLHGAAPHEPLDRARALYERVSQEAAASLRSHVESSDVLVVHDPQPLGAGAFLAREHCPRRIWRCHIGLPYENDQTRAAWSFLDPYLSGYDRLLFSSERYIPPQLEPRSGVVQPGIDPLGYKNRDLRPYKLIGILCSAGVVAGPETPAWARFDARVRRLQDGAWIEQPIPDALHTPLVVQVSRFDRLKGFHVLIPAFQRLLEIGAERAVHMQVDLDRARSELDRVQLVLAGPDPSGVTDDPEATEVLEELCRLHQALPPDVGRRVHILRLPMVNPKQNALVVNALQRLASVVVQNSIEEGFGLTVTEPLWKGVPVVASDVGGIGLQIRPGTDGVLVEDPHDPAAIARAVLEQLLLRTRAEEMAQSGRRRAAEHFLVVRQVRRWLEELRDLGPR